ncbi:hypothetical protein EK21DRAFT_113308 [Setomelanomma holmii]|uniref:Uncharacterized protein n=1 Tax=Setomelanomma holmii TaxID=210430 RepID=A0A9P4LJE0_9PLEO|nr:hypothetical protein EK21DRAFT_113308 [Setomelanomma holmii]
MSNFKGSWGRAKVKSASLLKRLNSVKPLDDGIQPNANAQPTIDEGKRKEERSDSDVAEDLRRINAIRAHSNVCDNTQALASHVTAVSEAHEAPEPRKGDRTTDSTAPEPLPEPSPISTTTRSTNTVKPSQPIHLSFDPALEARTSFLTRLILDYLIYAYAVPIAKVHLLASHLDYCQAHDGSYVLNLLLNTFAHDFEPDKTHLAFPQLALHSSMRTKADNQSKSALAERIGTDLVVLERITGCGDVAMRDLIATAVRGFGQKELGDGWFEKERKESLVAWKDEVVGNVDEVEEAGDGLGGWIRCDRRGGVKDDSGSLQTKWRAIRKDEFGKNAFAKKSNIRKISATITIVTSEPTLKVAKRQYQEKQKTKVAKHGNELNHVDEIGRVEEVDGVDRLDGVNEVDMENVMVAGQEMLSEAIMQLAESKGEVFEALDAVDGEDGIEAEQDMLTEAILQLVGGMGAP